jgi:hypothetical protein
VNYYGQPDLDHLKALIDAEVRNGIHSLRASYLSRKYRIDIALVQQVLSDLVATGDLQAHYQVLCSGKKQQYDVDREYESKHEIPSSEIVCKKCGDRYVPSEENILLSFEPTESYIESVAQQRD